MVNGHDPEINKEDWNMKFKQKPYIATYAETAFSGIGIVEVDPYGDWVKVQHYTDNEVSPTSTCQLHQDGGGNWYFHTYHTKYYLSEFMRTDLFS
jgi:hypothetical protein